VAAEEFQRELKVFMKMKPDTHLLELLATFEVDFDGYIGYSFLFPWAEGGGLDNLWKRHPANLLSAQTREPGALLRWMAEQIHGLAAGLHSIHDLRVQAMKRAKLEDTKQERDEENYGIHGDIKPENILHFSQLGEPGSLGILKIADFGLTDFHTLGSRTFDVNRDTRFAAPTYSSPELAQPGGTFSRKADIWAVGCVLSQFITWAAHGPDAVKQFDKLRQEEKDYDHTAKTDKRIIMDTFFRVEYFSKGRVQTYTKRATKNWLQKMQRTLRTSGKDNFVTTMCDILLRKVLVAERVKRIGCNDLVVEFRQLAAVDERLNSQFWNPRLPAFRSPTT
jgi:serine/threonine protein kinase